MVTQTERITKMETNIDNIKESLIRNDKDHEKLFRKLDNFILSADKKYGEKSQVESNTHAISDINTTIARYVGGGAVIILIVQIFLWVWLR